MPEGDASALVAEAARAYDQNQLDEALRLLARAYTLSPRPSILYNQAQVLRAKDDCAAALDAYQRFIATTTPDDPNRTRALQRRAEMQACLDRRRGERTADGAPGAVGPGAESSSPVTPPLMAPPEEAPPAGPTAPGPVPSPPAEGTSRALAPSLIVGTPVQTSPADDPGRGRRRAMRATGWALIGVGVLAASAAAVFAWRAHDAQEALNSATTWTLDQQSLEDDGRQDAALARWCGVAAAVAGGGGAALLVVSRPTATPPGGASSHAGAALARMVGNVLTR